MECHRCQWAAKIREGGFAGVRFEDTPCADCTLDEKSCWTRTYDERAGKNPGVGAEDGGRGAEDGGSAAVMPVSVLSDALRLLLSLPKEALEIVQYRHAGVPYAVIGDVLGVTEAAVCLRHARLMRRYPALRELFPDKARRQAYGKGNGRSALGR